MHKRPPKKNTHNLRATLISTTIKSLITGTPLLFSLTATERLQAAPISLSSTSAQVVLQSPTYGGANSFDAPASATLSGGMTSDNSKDWTFTNEGTITTTATTTPAVLIGSATNTSSLTNSGLIANTAPSGSAGAGVIFSQGGTLTNNVAGTIRSNSFYGVLTMGTAVTIINDGTIDGPSSGIRLGAGGTVTQGATGKITSSGNGAGIVSDKGPITITNNGGSITGTMGIWVRGSGIGTITNSGTITGTGGTAINIANTTNGVSLILQTGSIINGTVTSAGANTSLELQGSGTANNTFSGFSKISVQQAGTNWTLGGNVSTTGSTALVDVQNGQLNIVGTLTNTGGFSVSNNGTLQVTGTMTNAGVSNIASSGTLMIGNGGSTGSTTGNITNDGTIIFNRSNDMTLNGVISGNGSVQKLGTNTLYINGANFYTGSTTIEGRIQLNNTQGLGTGGIILSSATDSLIFATANSQTASGLLTNAISGVGNVALNSQENIILTGNNTNFSGLFDIGSVATLVATSAESLGTARITDNGIFQADAATNWSLANTLTGTGKFIKSGSGQLQVDQVNHSGTTSIEDGTLLIGSGSSSAVLGLAGSAGAVTVNSGATLSGTGTVNGAVVNQGTIAALNTVGGYTQNPVSNLTLNSTLDNSSGTINLAGDNVGNTLTVIGNYTGGGTVHLNTQLSDDTSLSDKLIIKGSTSGATDVFINSKGGNGSQTVAGIKMVEVDGASDGSFNLSNRVTIGMYDYNLNKASDGSWYLQSLKFTHPLSDSLIPEIGVALGNQTAAQTMFAHSMYDRMGDLRNGVATIGNGGWVRVSGGRAEFNAGGDVLSQKIDMTRLQFGADVATIKTSNGNWQAGLMGSYAHARTNSSSSNNYYTSNYNTSDASGKVEGYTFGAYATWLQKDNAGLYVDSWLQLGSFRNRINDNNQSDYNSKGLSASVETGYRFGLGAIGNMAWSVEPQAQVIFSKLNSNDYTTVTGMSASEAGGSGTMGRLGVRLSGQDVNTGLSPFAEVNAWFGRNGADSVKFSDASGERVVSNDIPNTRIQLKAGLQGNLDKNWQVWGDVGTELGSNDFKTYQGSLGVRYNW